MPKSAKKKKVINKENSKVMKGGAGGDGMAARDYPFDPELPDIVNNLLNDIDGLTPEDRREINIDHFNNLFNTIGEGYDLLNQVLGDPGGAILKKIFNLDVSFPYDRLRNMMLGGSSNITQCNQTVGSKNETIRLGLPCIWCGAPLDDASECEHVLPVVAAALLLTFSGGPNVSSKTIMEWLLEYGWAHQLCNQVKSNDLFITTTDVPDYGRMFVPNFNLLQTRFYNVVIKSKSKCWSPTPLTNPELSTQVKRNCKLLLNDIANINQGQMRNASYHGITIVAPPDNPGIQIMIGMENVYPDYLFLRQIPGNYLGQLTLNGSISNITPSDFFKSGPPTNKLHWLDNINKGIKGHPIVFLFNLCRYLNLTKIGLLTQNKQAQQEALTRFFSGIRHQDLLSILSNTTELLVDGTKRSEFLARVTSIQRELVGAIAIFTEEERTKQRSLFQRTIRVSKRSGRSEKEVERAVKKRVGVYEKTFKKFEQDLKRLKKGNKPTYDAIIMSFNQNNIPKNFNEFKTYVNHCVLDGLSKEKTRVGGGIGKKMRKKGGAQLTPEQQQIINLIEIDLLVSGFIGASIQSIIKIMRIINTISVTYRDIIIKYFTLAQATNGSFLQKIGRSSKSEGIKVKELFKISVNNSDLAFKLAYLYGYVERAYIDGFQFLEAISSPNFVYQKTDIFAEAEINAVAHINEILPYEANIQEYFKTYSTVRRGSSTAGGDDEASGTTTSVLLNLYRPAQVAQAAAGRIRKKSQKNKKEKKNKNKKSKKLNKCKK